MERDLDADREPVRPFGEVETVASRRRGTRDGRACWTSPTPLRQLRARRGQADAVVADLEPERVVLPLGDAICTSPGPLRGETPCLIAFSTSGCRIRRGTSASRASGAMSNRTESRSWNRVCSISRYFWRNSSSSCSETPPRPIGRRSGAADRSAG